MATRPPRDVIDVGDGFWNIRGSFKIGGLVDIKTHCSLVRLESGSFVFLDAIAPTDDVRRWVDELTDGGKAVEAIINLHPFHTVFVRRTHETYPDAKLFGTQRHHRKLDDLSWEAERTEDAAFAERYAADFDFSVPRGVELIPADEKLHFSSVLAFHKASKTLHVDDTLNYARMPKLLRGLKKDLVRFHPSLAKVLERRAGAVADFRSWSEELIARLRDVDNLCTAHVGYLLALENDGAPIADRVEHAYRKLDGTLRKHESKYG